MHPAAVSLTTAIAQLGLTVAILILVRYQLQGLSPQTVDGKLVVADTCYLALPEDWPAACVYADVSACISLAIMLAYFVLQLCATLRTTHMTSSTANKLSPRRWHIAQLLVLMVGAVSWLAAASTLQHFAQRANAAGLAHAQQRAAVLACCWGSLGLFVLLLASEFMPAVLAQLTAKPGLPMQQQQHLQQCLQHSSQLQLGMTAYPPTAASGPAGRSYMSQLASFPAPNVALHSSRQQRQQQQQQQQQQSIAVGIPCAPAAPVRSAYSMPQLPPAGEGPGAYQAALLMGRGSFATGHIPAARMFSLQPPPPAAWGTAAAAAAAAASNSDSVAGRVVVVNRSV